MNLILLNPIGRAGSYFIHGLFDNHPEVASLPIIFDFYDHWRRCHALGQRPSTSRLVDSYLSASRLSYLFGGPGDESFYVDESGAKQRLKLDRGVFRAALLARLARGDGSRQDLLLAIHEVFAEMTGTPWKGKRFILLHEHAGFPFQLPARFSFADPLADFPEMRSLVTLRDPRNSHASMVTVCSGYRQLWRRGYHLMRGTGAIARLAVQALHYADKHPGCFRFVKTEELNQRPQAVLQEICDWIGITFHPTLLESTYLGRPRKRLTAFQSKESAFDPRDLLQERWRTVCTPAETEMINQIFANIHARFGYEARAGYRFWPALKAVLNPRGQRGALAYGFRLFFLLPVVFSAET